MTQTKKTVPGSEASSPAPQATQEQAPAPDRPVDQTPDRVDTDLLELGDRRVVHPQRVAVSRRGMVATAHHRASQAGAEMLAEGGNAVDAAVAAAFALGVCEPAASGLGGQTTMLVHLAESKRTFALDGSSRAPNRTAAEGFSKAQRLRGYRATTVPSTPATLAWALKDVWDAAPRPGPGAGHPAGRQGLSGQRAAAGPDPAGAQEARRRKRRALLPAWRTGAVRGRRPPPAAGAGRHPVPARRARSRGFLHRARSPRGSTRT